MDAGAADSRALKLYGVKDCHRVDQPRPAGAPFDFPQGRLRRFIRPFKGDGVAGEFCCPAEGFAVCDVVQQKHKAVGGNGIGGNRLLEPFHRVAHRFRSHGAVVYDLKALLL